MMRIARLILTFPAAGAPDTGGAAPLAGAASHATAPPKPLFVGSVFSDQSPTRSTGDVSKGGP